MASNSRRLFIALALLGFAAGGAAPAIADPAAPVTIRGNNGPTAAEVADRSSIVLRGTTPPVTPPAPVYACPPGYTIEPGTGCIAAGYGSEPEYYDWYWPYDFARHRPLRPHRRAMTGFARGPGLRGMPAHRFGGDHRSAGGFAVRAGRRGSMRCSGTICRSAKSEQRSEPHLRSEGERQQ